MIGGALPPVAAVCASTLPALQQKSDIATSAGLKTEMISPFIQVPLSSTARLQMHRAMTSYVSSDPAAHDYRASGIE